MALHVVVTSEATKAVRPQLSPAACNESSAAAHGMRFKTWLTYNHISYSFQRPRSHTCTRQATKRADCRILPLNYNRSPCTCFHIAYTSQIHVYRLCRHHLPTDNFETAHFIPSINVAQLFISSTHLLAPPAVLITPRSSNTHPYLPSPRVSSKAI